jgi:ABC-type lipoprotein release transport system permease subunit
MGAVALTGLLRKLLYEIAPTDPVTFVAITLLLIVISFLASWFPARRAAKIDPIVALRHE